MKSYVYQLATDQKNDIFSTCFKGVLRIFSWIYEVIVRATVFCYQRSIIKRHCLAQPVISVGNVTMGGVGKTPLVQLIIRFFNEKNFKPAVLIRGYMNRDGVESDEAKMLKESFEDVPVVVGRNRFQSAQTFLKNGSCDCFVLDDGFQHWPLARTLDLVAIDARNPFGNGALIPRGVLREPLASLNRADAVVLTKVNQSRENVDKIKEQILSVHKRCPIFEAAHQPVGISDLRTNAESDCSVLDGQSVVAFCSIGDSESFVFSLSSAGAVVQKVFSFIDHHVYSRTDIEMINSYCQKEGVKTLVTTEKDMVKLKDLLKEFDDELKIFVLHIKLEILENQDKFYQLIENAVASKS